jgi:catechol 1,2-dioxygenase
MSSTHATGRPSSPDDLLRTVLAENQRTEPERLRELIDALVRHLFAFARETRLNYFELEQALQFINEVGKATGPMKNEAILLSDVLGLSTLVQLQDAQRILDAGGTEPGLIGPFWRANHPPLPAGADIFTPDTPGERLQLNIQVQDLEGRPIPGALVDVWQASPVGKYENQDPDQADMNLRGRFTTDAQGATHLRTVRPAGYPIPIDGPVGVLLAQQKRHPMRPAHIHFIVIAEGYRVLSTQIFDEVDEHIDSDVVFGAIGSLVRRFEANPQRPGELLLNVTLSLEPGPTVIPHPPLD